MRGFWMVGIERSTGTMGTGTFDEARGRVAG